MLVLTNGVVCEDPENILGDAEKARNAAEAAAATLFGLLSERAAAPLANVRTFLSEQSARSSIPIGHCSGIRWQGGPRMLCI